MRFNISIKAILKKWLVQLTCMVRFLCRNPNPMVEIKKGGDYWGRLDWSTCGREKANKKLLECWVGSQCTRTQMLPMRILRWYFIDSEKVVIISSSFHGSEVLSFPPVILLPDTEFYHRYHAFLVFSANDNWPSHQPPFLCVFLQRVKKYSGCIHQILWVVYDSIRPSTLHNEWCCHSFHQIPLYNLNIILYQSSS